MFIHLKIKKVLHPVLVNFIYTLLKAATHKLAQARSRQATLARTEDGLRDGLTRMRERPKSMGARRSRSATPSKS